MKTNTEARYFLDALVTSIGTGVLSFDMEGFVTLANSRALEYLNITAKVNEVIDRDILSLLSNTKLKTKVNHCLTKSRKEFQLNIHVEDKYLIVVGKKLLDGMLLSITDATANVLAKNKSTQLLLLGQETERSRLAKEIHDGVGPSMSTLKLQLDAVKKKMLNPDNQKAVEKIAESISEIAQDIRQISHDLMPRSLIDFGIVTALSNFSNKISDTEAIEVQYHSNMTDKSLPQGYELNIFRIVQELVNNSLKYSKCTLIKINLTSQDDFIKLLVKDDGIGMDKEVRKDGMGLHNVQARVLLLQGHMEIETQVRAGSGVSIHVEIPMPIKQVSDQAK